jgi:thiol-disulfide isomerase/thioredoxin
MKKLLLGFISTFLLTNTHAQTPYTVIQNGDERILNGIISPYILQNDPHFTWYESSSKDIFEKSKLIPALANAAQDITILIFGGTWCEDTQNILPKFFTYQYKANFPDSKITFIGVDRQKKSLGNLASVMGITNVPTIIVLKNGKEVGRVVEHGITGLWDEELSELLK